MIDVQNYVRTMVFRAVRSEVGGITTTSEDWDGEASLPCVVFRETDNYTDGAKSESDRPEVAAVHLFEAQALSGVSNAECLRVMAVADDVMQSLGFRRTLVQTIGTADRSVRRVVARWRGTVTEDGQVGSR